MDRNESTPAARRIGELPAAKAAEKRRPFPIILIWLVPVIAAAAGGVLAYQALILTGPRITIRFEDGTGLGDHRQTVIRYHGVDCGTVDSMRLAENRKDVIVSATLKRNAADIASEGSRFWIVRPEVSIIGVRGLETLMSGPYIQVMPGKGPKQTSFVGLSNAPPPETLDPGLDVVLESDRRGALRVGSPVYYREVEVGKIKSYALARSSDAVAITAHIDAAHAALVHTNSRFRNVSGLRMNIGMHGVNLDLESIESLVAGGVAFETPAGGGTPAKDGTVF